MCECCDYISARGGAPGDPVLTAQFQHVHRERIRQLIAADSWLVQFVTGTFPAVAYTVGLWSRGHPEVAVFGVEGQRSVRLLNRVGAAALAGEVDLLGDEPFEIDGRTYCALPVPNPDDVVPQANVFYRRRRSRSVPAVQLVYPDARGVWPWEPGCLLLPGLQPMPGAYRPDTGDV